MFQPIPRPRRVAATALSLALLSILSAPSLAADDPCIRPDGSSDPAANTDAGNENGRDNTTCSTSASAYGIDNKAHSANSSALGGGNYAHGRRSSAFGAGNTAYGDDTSAFGFANSVGAIYTKYQSVTDYYVFSNSLTAFAQLNDLFRR